MVKDVKLLPETAAPRPAAVNDAVRNGIAVRTGVESRTELTFTDQTLARLGSEYHFYFRRRHQESRSKGWCDASTRAEECGWSED